MNLNLAVYDETERSLPPIATTKTVTIRASLREMLQEGKFKSPSLAILMKTVGQLKAEKRAKETARKRAAINRLKLKTKTKISLEKMSKYMERLAVKEKEEKIRQRRREMGLPEDLDMQKIANTIKIAQMIERNALMEDIQDPVKFPKIIVEKSKCKGKADQKKPLLGQEDDDTDTSLGECKSYGGFLSSEFSTNYLPKIQPCHGPTQIPTRPAYFRKSKKIRVPRHLERFRFMRIKNCSENM